MHSMMIKFAQGQRNVSLHVCTMTLFWLQGNVWRMWEWRQWIVAMLWVVGDSFLLCQNITSFLIM